MAAKKKTRLSKLRSFEVSLVKAGAVGRKLLFFKSDEGETMEEIFKSILAEKFANQEELDKVLKEKLAGVSKEDAEKITAAVSGAVRLLSAVNKELPEGLLAASIGVLEGVELKIEKTSSTPAKPDAKVEKTEAPKPGEEVKISKEAQTQIDELVQKNESLAASLKVEKDIRIEKDLDSRVAELKHIAMEPKELRLVLKNAQSTMDKDGLKSFNDMMDKQNEAIKKSASLNEIGSSLGGGAPTSAEDKIQKMADDMAEKDPKLTAETAYSLVLKNHPKLYSQYQKEKADRSA